MATGQEIVTDALYEISVITDEVPMESSYMVRGMRKLNDMLSEWDKSGIPLGFIPLADETDDVLIPREYNNAVIVNLAGLLAPTFNKEVGPTLAAKIKSANDALLNMTVKIGRTTLPSTLPTGSGNGVGYCDERFFPETDTTNF